MVKAKNGISNFFVRLFYTLPSATLKYTKSISTYLPHIVVFLCVSAVFATYIALSQSDRFGVSSRSIFILINIDLILLLSLATVVVRKLVKLWAARRQGLAGSQLHVRLVAIFSLLTVIPAILMTVFSVLFFNFGLQAWFSHHVESALQNSMAVAEAYIKEHHNLLKSDALSLAQALKQGGGLYFYTARSNLFSKTLSSLTSTGSIREAIIFDGSRQVLARSNFTFALEFSFVPHSALELARQGEIVLLDNDEKDRVRALVLLDRGLDLFLYVGRFVDPLVIKHQSETLHAVHEYNIMKGERSQIEISFTLIFAVVALLLLMAAVWIGLSFATQISNPVRRLIMASEKIRQGDLSVRIKTDSGQEEFSALSRAFNLMTNQLEEQHRDLLGVNQQLDARRRFTESVLDGVLAGIIGLNRHGNITLINQHASIFLQTPHEDCLSQHILKVFPEMKELFDDASQKGEKTFEGEVSRSINSIQKTFFIRILVDIRDDKIQGYVVTLDDMTQLISAQKQAAWSDVARRIAHEIKNPLTPIQLSAERLKRKYLKEVKTDPEIFSSCTDTIIRQVESIGRMVDEFSAFARMPRPIMLSENLVELCQQAIFLQKGNQRLLNIDWEAKEPTIIALCDRRLISQALTNLLKNSIDSIESVQAHNPGYLGKILVRIKGDPVPSISVIDNGKGFDPKLAERFTDPYVTTKTKGTGLGLAIVKKIMEDHGGSLTLNDILSVSLASDSPGAQVNLIFSGELTHGS